MGNFKRNNNSDRRGKGGGFSGRNPRRPVTMHKAICSECGKDCEVPFKPTGDKPVFCSDCFRNKRNDAPGRFGGKDFGKSNFGDRRMYKAVCDKCGKECEVPFKPTSDKPIYCNECFNKVGKGRSLDEAGRQQAGRQLEIINAKLDEILKVLTSFIPAKANEKKKNIPTKKEAVKLKPKKDSKSKGKKVASPKKAKEKKKK